MSKSGKNLSDLQDLNRAQVLRYLVRHRGCSRAEIGAVSGLTLASITKIIRSLMESDAVFETGYSEGKKGRRSVGLSFHYEKYKVLSINLSWERMVMQVFDFQGTSYGGPLSLPFRSLTIDSAPAVTQMMLEGIRQLRTRYPEICAIGMSVFGPYDREEGSVLLPPYSRDPDKRTFYPLRSTIAEATSLPVFLEHDADAGALAYWWFGRDIDPHQVILNLLVSDGVGMGLVKNGRIIPGTYELGHVSIDYRGRKCTCGSNGCLNAYCSASALKQLALEDLPAHPDSRLAAVSDLSFQSILDAAARGDAYASHLIFEEGRYLGHGLLSLLQIFNPDTIVISGCLASGGQTLLSGISETLSDRHSGFTKDPLITLADYDQDLNLLGGLTCAMDRMLQEPTKYLSLSVTGGEGTD